jgi:hypothetical protein
MKYKNLFENHPIINEAYEVCGEWKVWIGFQPVKIRVIQGLDGKYYYETSHYYQGSQQASPCVSSINGYDSIEQAINGAKAQLLAFYREDDEEAVWVKNEDY